MIYLILEWRSLEEKPIEKRNFTKSGSKMPQGTVRLWVELIDIKEILEISVKTYYI
jgi:hypothetical protein